jgi:para-aminobenzoate synthetase component I
VRFRPRVFELPCALSTSALLRCLSKRRGLVALDSAGGEPRRFSLVAFNPIERLAPPCAIPALRAFCAELQAGDTTCVPGPFHGGFIGAFSYDLGVAGEEQCLPRDAWHSPLVIGGLYTDFIVRDEQAERAWLVLADDPGDERPSVDERRAEVLIALAQTSHPPRATTPIELVRHTSPAEHRARVERIRERIACGDLYQANLAHRSTARVLQDPVEIYARLRAVNPAPYMGYLAWDAGMAHAADDFPRGALLSASPELLLEFDGTLARTRPIKGTAPRGATPVLDRELAAGLVASAKDRAELAMIVDLERNDLGRCARAGRVWVEDFPRLESYASVHHLSADVVAEVRAGVDATDLLAALFPGGSITGAPKLAAMELIAAEEHEGRGMFCGALGFVDTRGHAQFNILIRTLVWRPHAQQAGEVAFHVGGGITWSSDPAAEERETLDKGAALVHALQPEREA